MDSLYVEYGNDRELYQSYMPFLKNGGLFIKTAKRLGLGAEVSLSVLLPDSLEQSEVTGNVCWVTPIGSQNGTPSGVGISFDKDPDNVKHQIEKSLARHLNSTEPTLTM